MNILFITADQWRGECLSALGHPIIETPNLDRLASDGVLFKQHYAQATPCSPSRTSLHTGMYLHNHRVCNNGTPLDARHSNWAQEVRKVGYQPYLFGYTDTASDPREYDHSDPRLRHYSEPLPGIKTDTVYRDNMSQNWIDHLRACGYSIPKIQWDIYNLEKNGLQWENGGDRPLALTVESDDHETGFLVNQCIDWIDSQDGPWITHLSLFRPHPPFVAPEPYNRLFSPEIVDQYYRLPSLESEKMQHPWLSYQLNQPKFRAPDNPMTLDRLKASYYGLMKEVDDNLGHLFNALKASGQWHDTLIIFTSDHGEQMGDHWLMSKSGYFDASYYIPLIIRDPRQQANCSRGQQIEHFTENVDIMPTMLDWLGQDIPSQCDGYSLLPFIQNETTPTRWRDEVHWEYDFRNPLDTSIEEKLGITQHQCTLNVIRDNEYKYVHFTALPPLFFDLTKDPHEFINLTDNPDYRERVLHYAQKLISWRMNFEDRALTETVLSENGPVTRRAPTQHIQ